MIMAVSMATVKKLKLAHRMILKFNECVNVISTAHS